MGGGNDWYGAVEIGLLHFSLGCTLALLFTEIFRGDRWLNPVNDSDAAQSATARLRARWNRIRAIQAVLASIPLLIIWVQSLVSPEGFNPQSVRWLTSGMLIWLAIFILQTVGVARFGSQFQELETGPVRLARYFSIGMLTLSAGSTAFWLCGIGPGAVSNLSILAGIDEILSAMLLAAAFSAACGVVELSESDPSEVNVTPWPWHQWGITAGIVWLPQILLAAWRIGFGPKIEDTDELMILLVFLMGRLVAGAISWQANQSLAKLAQADDAPSSRSSKKKKKPLTPRARTIARITTLIAALVAVLCHTIAGSIAPQVLWP